MTEKIAMYVSTVAAGEFQVGQDFTDLPLRTFRIQPYMLNHAVRAGDFFKVLKAESALKTPGDERKVIVNDLKLIAQAAEDEIDVILTEDESTLSRTADRLHAAKVSKVRTVLLKNGFNAFALSSAGQAALVLVPAAGMPAAMTPPIEVIGLTESTSSPTPPEGAAPPVSAPPTTAAPTAVELSASPSAPSPMPTPEPAAGTLPAPAAAAEAEEPSSQPSPPATAG